ncbi:MAG: ABC transporter substrate-binding protein [Rhizobiaceae bacterium]
MKRWVLKTASTLVCTAFAFGASAADDVKVRFSWKLKAEYAQFYLGQQSGLYEAEGIAPTFGEGAGAQAAVASLIQGQEDIAVIPGVFALTAIQKDMPIKIIALYQPVVPLVILSHPEAPVAAPKDMEGKSIASCTGDTAGEYLSVFCQKNGIDCGKITVVRMDCGARIPQFTQKGVDMVSTYLNIDVPVLKERLGVSFPLMTMADYGMKVPGLALVASDAAIAAKPDVLKRFLKATSGAVQAMSADPQAATDALKAIWSPAPSDAVALEQVQATVATFVAKEGHPVGWVDEADIAEALALLSTESSFGTAKDPKAFYTNELFE